MKPIIKLFWRMTSNRFLLQELHDHNHLLCNFLLPDDEREHIQYLLKEYIVPEVKRRGME